MSERLTVSFDLTAGQTEDPDTKARAIALEQTVEIPEDCFSEEIERRVVGRIEELTRVGRDRHRLRISYSTELIGPDLSQLVNLVYGNVSMMSGVRVSAVDWPEEVLARFGGPRFGIEGLRSLCGEPARALVCAAIKPVGLSVDELARDCARFARGGADIIKDDHSLADQELAPFAARVERCQAAVEDANRATGGNTFYFPNLTGSPARLAERADLAKARGCRGAMVSPMILGLETVRWIGEETGLALLGHPTFSGAFFTPGHGIAPNVLFGDLFRIAGCDGVIYVNAGGRFGWSQERCDAIHRAATRPLGGLRPSFPIPAGGVQVGDVPTWLARYGDDTMILIGGSLYQQGDIESATRGLVRAAEEASG